MARLISLGIILGLIAVFGLLSLRVLAGFLLPLLLAAMLVVIFGPLYRWLRQVLRSPDWVAAGLTTAFVLLIVLMFFIPLYPTKATYYPRLVTYADYYDTHDAVSALIFVLITDFEYEHVHDDPLLAYYPDGRPDILADIQPMYPVTVYRASPTFLIVYAFLVPLLYILGCYGVERVRWKKRNVYPKGVRDL